MTATVNQKGAWEKVKPLERPKSVIIKIAENVAEIIRYKPSLSFKEFGDLISIYGTIKKKGFWDLENSNDGSIQIDKHGFKIILPDYVSEERNRFTLAHELGHFFLHYVLQGKRGTEVELKAARFSVGPQNLAEKEANWFAAGFLMPEKNFKKQWRDNNGNLRVVSELFNVSKEAAKYHAEYLSLRYPPK